MKRTLPQKALAFGLQLAVATQLFGSLSAPAFADIVPPDQKSIPVCTYLHGFENFPRLTFLLEEKSPTGTRTLREAKQNECIEVSYKLNTIKLYAISTSRFQTKVNDANYNPASDELAYPSDGDLEAKPKLVSATSQLEYEKYNYSLDGVDNTNKLLKVSLISKQTNLGLTEGKVQNSVEYAKDIASPESQNGGVSEIVKPFNDIPLISTYYTAVTYLKKNDLVNGYPDGTYRPELRINRAEFTKILVNASRKDPSNGLCIEGYSNKNGSYRNMFSDVITSKQEWFLDFICYAKSLHLIDGYPDGSFRPKQEITVAEASKIIAKAFNLSTGESSTPWYRGYVMALASKNALPRTITRFDQKITRGEMGEIIYRLKSGNTKLPSKTYAELQ